MDNKVVEKKPLLPTDPMKDIPWKWLFLILGAMVMARIIVELRK